LPSATRVHHLGIAVESIEKALGLYRALGLETAHETVVETERVKVAMLPAGDSRIELLEPLGPESPIARFLAKHGEGLHHVALAVDNLDEAIARLADSGARLVSEPGIGAEGYRYVFVHPKSAGGVLLELVEAPAAEDPPFKGAPVSP
jgi:methylmalonyl-CoA epimerase